MRMMFAYAPPPLLSSPSQVVANLMLFAWLADVKYWSEQMKVALFQIHIRRDAMRREVARIDGRGNVTRTVYDSLGRVVATVDALTNVTTFAYDTYGANTIAYAYNVRGELTNAVSDVDANYAYAYQYDDIGNRFLDIELAYDAICQTF